MMNSKTFELIESFLVVSGFLLFDLWPECPKYLKITNEATANSSGFRNTSRLNHDERKMEEIFVTITSGKCLAVLSSSLIETNTGFPISKSKMLPNVVFLVKLQNNVGQINGSGNRSQQAALARA